MDLLTPVVTGALLALFTAIQYRLNRDRFESIERRLDGMERQFDQLRSELAQVRADIFQVALALGQRPQPHTG